MIGIVFGLIAGLVLPGGWWTLLGVSAVLSIGIGCWRIVGAHRRLRQAQDYPRALRDARNITLTSGASNPEALAFYIIESGEVPDPTPLSYIVASWSEFIAMAIAASITRLVKIFLFSG